MAIGYAVEFGKAAFDEVVMQGLLQEPQYSWWLEGLCLCYMLGRTPLKEKGIVVFRCICRLDVWSSELSNLAFEPVDEHYASHAAGG